MKLFVLRHGRAESWAESDAKRRLTYEGERQVDAQLDRCRDALAGLECVWVSPLTRARQTADRVMQAVAGHASQEVKAGLSPEGSVHDIYQQLQSCDCETLLLVSHQPLAGALVNDLSGHEPGYYPMATASLARIDFEIAASGLGDLQWIRHPE